MHRKEVITSGTELGKAKKALILLHGRGATAQDILGLGHELTIDGFSLIAPQATNFTWYPYSFMAPVKQNEPWLSSALSLLNELVDDITRTGIDKKNIFFAGFSQGACLTLEFVTRNATRWGGVAAFTGGLIGDKIYDENYRGDFSGTPVFIGSSDPDPHVPVQRVEASATIIKSMNADIMTKIYPQMGHTINHDEIRLVNQHIFKK